MKNILVLFFFFLVGQISSAQDVYEFLSEEAVVFDVQNIALPNTPQNLLLIQKLSEPRIQVFKGYALAQSAVKTIDDKVFLYDYVSFLKYNTYVFYNGEEVLERKKIPLIEAIHTEEKKNILGYPCNEYIVVDSLNPIKIWVCDGLPKAINCGIFLKNIAGAVLEWRDAKGNSGKISSIKKIPENSGIPSLDTTKYKILDYTIEKPKNMAESKELKLGKPISNFTFYDLNNKKFTLKNLKKAPFLICILSKTALNFEDNPLLEDLAKLNRKYPKLKMLLIITESGLRINHILKKEYPFPIIPDLPPVTNVWRQPQPTYILVKNSIIQFLNAGDYDDTLPLLEMEINKLYQKH